MEATSPPRGFERRAFDPARPKPRPTHFRFPSDVPRYWVGGSPTRTHLMNSIHLFIPSFERMIMRTVLDRAIPRLRDRALIEQARGLAGQESTHSRAHERFVRNLREQGYRVDAYLRATEWFFEDLLEKKVGLSLGLSIFAAFEHYTDLLVVLVLRGDFLDGCDPRMRELLEWHAAEEAEHHAVGHALLAAIAPGYALRMLGGVLGVAVVLGFVLSGALLLLAQDRQLWTAGATRELGQFLFTKHGVLRDVARLFVQYARPGYRPDELDRTELARAVLDPAPVVTD